MSAPARFFLVLAAVCTVTLVKTLPPSNPQRRPFGGGNNWNIPRSQLFQPSYSSDQHGIPQARRDDYVTSADCLDHSINNETDIHTQRANTGSQRTTSVNFQSSDTGSLPNPSPHRVVNHHVQTHHKIPCTEHLSIHRSNHQIPTNGATSSRINSHDSSLVVQNSEPHAASRGNRRVITDSAMQRTQAHSNLNEEIAKPTYKVFETNLPEANTSEHSHKNGETRAQNSGEIVTIQSRIGSMQQPSQNDYIREKLPLVNSSQNRSNGNENKLPTPSAHGRIVTPTNTFERNHRNMSTGLNHWEATATPAAILSSAEFGGGGNSSRQGGEAIVFPDAKFKPNIAGDKAPACAQGSTYCTEVDDYPLPHLSNVLKNDINYREYFGVEPTPDDQTIKHRIGDEGEEMCLSKTQTIFPKLAQNKDDKWMFIVNLDDKEYMQGIAVQICSNLDGPCQLSQGFPPGYLTSCRQKYIYRKLLALNDDGQPIPDSFKLPSCCACYFRKTPIGNRISSVTQKSQG